MLLALGTLMHSAWHTWHILAAVALFGVACSDNRRTSSASSSADSGPNDGANAGYHLHPPAAHREAPLACNTDRGALPIPTPSPSPTCTGLNAFRCVTPGGIGDRCVSDTCATDDDCSATDQRPGVCVCNSNCGRNACFFGNCAVDSDCGSGRYCSFSSGRVTCTAGYYCHTANDECADDADCNGDVCYYGGDHWKCGNYDCADYSGP
jgi:hypothetical protein